MNAFNITTIRQKCKALLAQMDLGSEHKGRGWIWLTLALGLTAWLSQREPAQDTPDPQPKTTELAFDTYIPENHSLIPITVSDYKSLDQVIGHFGVVDLYTAPASENQYSRLLAQAVKIVRHGKNSDHFSVLVPKDEATAITSHSGEFKVTVRHPESVGTKIVKRKREPKRRITYESE